MMKHGRKLRWPTRTIQQYIFQHNNIYSSTTIYIPVQEYIYIYICFFRYGILVQKYARTPRAVWRPPCMTASESDSRSNKSILKRPTPPVRYYRALQISSFQYRNKKGKGYREEIAFYNYAPPSSSQSDTDIDGTMEAHRKSAFAENYLKPPIILHKRGKSPKDKPAKSQIQLQGHHAWRPPKLLEESMQPCHSLAHSVLESEVIIP